MKTVRYGSTGEDVRVLQKILGLDADGIFGRLTLAAVIAFQTAAGLDADGIVGPLTWAALTAAPAQETPIESEIQPPDFKQYDARWGSVPFTITGDKTQTIRTSGCGPTAMADVVAHWWDASVTPVDMCRFAVEGGFRTPDAGVSGDFFGAVAQRYNARRVIRTGSLPVAESCLKDGGLVIVCFGPGKWTTGGHFCLMWQVTGNMFRINDPGSGSERRQTGTYSEVKAQARGFWCIYR